MNPMLKTFQFYTVERARQKSANGGWHLGCKGDQQFVSMAAAFIAAGK
jgi:hypothetical protein